jgi:hypothetical protein
MHRLPDGEGCVHSRPKESATVNSVYNENPFKLDANTHENNVTIKVFESEITVTPYDR